MKKGQVHEYFLSIEQIMINQPQMSTSEEEEEGATLDLLLYAFHRRNISSFACSCSQNIFSSWLLLKWRSEWKKTIIPIVQSNTIDNYYSPGLIDYEEDLKKKIAEGKFLNCVILYSLKVKLKNNYSKRRIFFRRFIRGNLWRNKIQCPAEWRKYSLQYVRRKCEENNFDLFDFYCFLCCTCYLQGKKLAGLVSKCDVLQSKLEIAEQFKAKNEELSKKNVRILSEKKHSNPYIMYILL